MLNSITNSSAIKYMENSLILTPVAGIIRTAVGIIKALGSLFADNKSKAFSAAFGQIGHGLRNMVPYIGYHKNLDEFVAKVRKDTAVEAAENVVRKQAQAAVKEAGSVTSEAEAIEAVQNATEVFAKRAAEDSIKDFRSEMGEVAAEEAIEAAVQAAKKLAAEIGKDAFIDSQVTF